MNKEVKKQNFNKVLNLMKEQKRKFINYTKEVWQPYYGEELSDNDANEIIDNMTAFMNLLIKWDKADKEKRMSSEPCSSQASELPLRK